MKINIKLHSELSKFIDNYDKEKGITLDVFPGTNITEIINQFIPKESWGIATVIVTINNKITNHYYQVKEDDEINIFPISGGG
jgi:molybdopterin converting factor small subunit